MNLKSKLIHGFSEVQGGLITGASKNDDFEYLSRQGIKLMALADPFYPDPVMPESVKKAMIDAINAGFPGHYTAQNGLNELRQLLADRVSIRTGLTINPNRNILVTAGSDLGLFYSLIPFINDGDEIMVPDPSYPSNFVNPELLGGVVVPVPLYEEDNYQIRIEEFEKRRTDKTKIVLITQPNNPTTTVFQRDSLEKLCDFIVKNDLILISDQAFEDHIYDGIEFISPSSMPGMWERTLTICSISKGFGLSGLRIGYIYGDEKIIDVLYGAAVDALGPAATISMVGTIAALKEENYLSDNFQRLERRRRIAFDILSTIPGVRMKLPETGFMSWLDISQLGTSEEVACYLLKEARILVNSGSSYGNRGEGFIRIITGSFFEDSDATEAFNQIKTALTSLAESKGIK